MYDRLYQSVLSRFDPEGIHHFTVDALRAAGAFSPTRSLLARVFSPALHYPPITVAGLTFGHPLGLAGGFDKDAHCLPALQALGFSFIEVGTVTPQPQPGNPAPRLFRLSKDRALINRMGFPSSGVRAVTERLRNVRSIQVPIAISLGKNKATPLADAARDYVAVLDALYAYGDCFVVNISSPNTPDLRKLQTRAYLADLLGAVLGAIRRLSAGQAPKPLFVKIAPDLTWAELDDLLDAALSQQINGIIATNTTLERTGLGSPYQAEAGGLSGQPLRQRSTDMIRYVYHRTEKRLPIIGVGGIFTGDDIWEKLSAGASLVQAYTGLIYNGPAFVKTAIHQLDARMQREGIRRYQDIIGRN